MADDEFAETNQVRPGEVSVPRGLFVRRNRSVFSKRRPVDEILNAVEGESDALKSYKVTIPICPTITSVRPVPTCCSLCFPEIRKTVNSKCVTLGIRNCLSYRTENNCNPWYVRKCSSLVHFWSKVELFSKYKLIPLEEIIQDAHFILNLEKLAGEPDCKESDLSKSGSKVRAMKFLHSIGVTSASDWVVQLGGRLVSWIASRIFGLMFEAVCVHDGQLALLKSIQNVHPFIYVTLQRSNWDHFILNWVLWESDIQPPRLIGRRSLIKDTLLGPLSKLIGCLGRSGSNKGTEKDAIHDFALEACLRSLLKTGKSLEFAVEQHRSRNGFPGTVFVGTELFNVISTCIHENEIDEAFVVPVSVSYEKFPECEIIGNYTVHRHSNIFSRVWSLLRQRLGFVRLNFGHPISVREYQTCVMTPQKLEHLIKLNDKDEFFWHTDGYCNNLYAKQLNWDDDAGSVTSLSSVYQHMDRFGNPSDREATLFADSLTCHAIHDALKCSVLMSTNIVAFLLMSKYRQHGVCAKTLEEDVEDLIYLLRGRKKDVGFSTKCAINGVVKRAVRLLGSSLVQTAYRDGVCYFLPVISRSSLVELSFYGNPVVAVFAMEGVVATALFALCRKKLSIYNGSRVKVFVQEDQLVEKAKQLALLLKAQFLLHPPCQQLGEAIKYTIDAMRDDYLVNYDVGKVYRHDDDLDDWDTVGGAGDFTYSSERLEIRAVEEPVVYQKLYLVHSLIVPYLQAYAEAFTVLHDLLPSANGPQCVPEMNMRKRILDLLLVTPEILPELAILDTARSFLVSMKHLGVLYETTDETTGQIFLHLEKEYSQEIDLESVRNNILYFCSF